MPSLDEVRKFARVFAGDNVDSWIKDNYSSLGITQEQNPERLTGVVPDAQMPAKSQALDALKQQQKQLADQFRSKIPEYSDTLYNKSAKNTKQQLAQSINQTRTDFNRRGLLNSGKRMSSELGARSNAANSLYQSRGDINNALLGQADSLENNYVNTGFAQAGLGAGLGAGALSSQQTDLQQQIAALQAQQQIYSGLGQGIGSIGGGLIAGLNKKPGTFSPQGYGGSPGSYYQPTNF